MAEVRLENVVKRYGGFTALPKLDLHVNEGEFLVLLGPSGCGKTTTMRLIAGLEEVTEGDLFIGKERVNDKAPKDRDIAMVFQNYGLYPHMSVADNIGYPLKLRGLGKVERMAQVRAVADKVELGALLDRRPSELSGGQRQRVALARAIVRRPQLFLMDEPLSNLDAKLRVTMRAELKHMHYEMGVTTVYVTHDQMEAMTLASRIVVMNKGRIVQLDTPERIYSEPADLFVADFIGSPSMNLIHGQIAGGQFVAEGIALPVSAPDRAAVVLGIRPEDLHLADPTTSPIKAPIFALELTGEATLVTLRAGSTQICARGPADFRAATDTLCGLAPRPGGRIHLFDPQSGLRLPDAPKGPMT
jgi:multiple sugar transport system ATP-binding protein